MACGFAVIGDVGQIAGRVDRGNGHANAPGPLNPQPGDDPLDTVGHIDDHALTGFKPVVQQGGGEAFGHGFDDLR